MTFTNREDAGDRLATRLKEYFEEPLAGIVLALSQGGVVVGDKIARSLNLPLALLLVKKIGLPGLPEYSLGAVDREGHYIVNPAVTPFVDKFTFEAERLKTIRLVDKENLAISEHSLTMDLNNKTVILVDDGANSGTTALAGVEIVKKHHPKVIALALPVCSLEALARLNHEVEVLIVDTLPSNFRSVSDSYNHFLPEKEEKIRSILQSYKAPHL